jgi:hypothetical protein
VPPVVGAVVPPAGLGRHRPRHARIDTGLPVRGVLSPGVDVAVPGLERGTQDRRQSARGEPAHHLELRAAQGFLHRGELTQQHGARPPVTAPGAGAPPPRFAGVDRDREVGLVGLGDRPGRGDQIPVGAGRGGQGGVARSAGGAGFVPVPQQRVPGVGHGPLDPLHPGHR